MKFGANKDIKINIRLCDYQYQFIKDVALSNSCTISEAVRKCIDALMLNEFRSIRREVIKNENIKNNLNDKL